jgi:hypothetical protein
VSRREDVVGKLEALVSFDPRELFDDASALKPVAEWSANSSLSIAGITSRELFSGKGADRRLIGVEHRVRFADRGKAICAALAELGPPAPDPADDRRPASQLTDAELSDRIAIQLTGRIRASPKH